MMFIQDFFCSPLVLEKLSKKDFEKASRLYPSCNWNNPPQILARCVVPSLLWFPMLIKKKHNNIWTRTHVFTAYQVKTRIVARMCKTDIYIHFILYMQQISH